MKHLEQARKFLVKAAEDEALLDAVLAKPEVSDSIYGFHAQPFGPADLQVPMLAALPPPHRSP